MALSLPDITPAQMVSVGGAVVATLVEFGVDLTAKQQAVLLADVGVVAALIGGDALIRHGRSKIAAAQIDAASAKAVAKIENPPEASS